MKQPRENNGRFGFKVVRDPAKPLRSIGYIRVSTEEQALKGISLEAQEYQIRGHCTLHSQSAGERTLDLIDVLSDKGKSAKSITNRPSLQKIMSMAENGEIDAVIVWRMDRIFRNLQDQINTISKWRDCGVRLIATDDMFDTHKASGRLFMNIKGAISQFESEQTGERVKLVKARKLDKLEYGGGAPPMGWQISKTKNAAGKRMLEPNVYEIEILSVIEHLRTKVTA